MRIPPLPQGSLTAPASVEDEMPQWGAPGELGEVDGELVRLWGAGVCDIHAYVWHEQVVVCQHTWWHVVLSCISALMCSAIVHSCFSA